MFGRFTLRSDGQIQEFLDTLDIDGQPIYSDDIAPGSQISIIYQKPAQLVTATWWLLLDRDTLKPNYKYASFNSRSDKLDQPRSIAYHPFRESRCIIPASSFVEGLGDKKTYHEVGLEGRAKGFGGLYKEWVNQDTGETVISDSIITLPPVTEWQHIHPKSIPLMLDTDNREGLNRWLDPDFTDIETFRDWLQPAVHHPQRVTPIDELSKKNPTDEAFTIT